MERETQQTMTRRMIAERQLNDLQMSYKSQEQHLRNVISKITSLRTQVRLQNLLCFILSTNLIVLTLIYISYHCTSLTYESEHVRSDKYNALIMCPKIMS